MFSPLFVTPAGLGIMAAGVGVGSYLGADNVQGRVGFKKEDGSIPIYGDVRFIAGLVGLLGARFLPFGIQAPAQFAGAIATLSLAASEIRAARNTGILFDFEVPSLQLQAPAETD